MLGHLADALYPAAKRPCGSLGVPAISSEPILGSELAQVRLKTLCHRVGVDTSDVAVVLVIDDLAEIALALSPGHTVRKEQKCGVRALGINDRLDVADHIGHF